MWSTQNNDPEQLESLKLLRASLNISDEQHNYLEAEVKNELMSNAGFDTIAPNEFVLMVQEPDKEQKMDKQPKQKKKKKKKIKKTEKPKSVKIKKYLTLGKDKYHKQDYYNALRLYSEALKLDPDSEEIEFLIKKTKNKIDIIESSNNDFDLNDEEFKEFNALFEDDTEPPGPVEEKEDSYVLSAIPVDNLNGAAVKPKDVEDFEKPAKIALPKAIPVTPNQTAPAGKPIEKAKAVTQDQTESSTPSSSPCISCNGTGQCYWCGGTKKCDRCGGTGTFMDNPCTMCRGTGNCNSCQGKGECMWCKGSGLSNRRLNGIYNKDK